MTEKQRGKKITKKYYKNIYTYYQDIHHSSVGLQFQQTFLHADLQVLKRGFISVLDIGFSISLRGEDELGKLVQCVRTK